MRNKPFAPFPSWRWHADFPEGRIFNSEDEIPAGWVDHPSKVKATPASLAKNIKAKAKP